MTMQRKEIQIGSTPLTFETGRLARQADGAVVVRHGDTVVLTTACIATSTQPRDFLPLTVDYREYSSAGGRIPGGFFKREGRPTEKEIITSRLIDRPLRPLFPDGYTQDTQIISLVPLRRRRERPRHPGDQRRLRRAGALATSRSTTRSARCASAIVDGERVFNPTNSQRDVADLDLVVVVDRGRGGDGRVRPPTRSPRRSCSTASSPRSARSQKIDPGPAPAVPRDGPGEARLAGAGAVSTGASTSRCARRSGIRCGQRSTPSPSTSARPRSTPWSSPTCRRCPPATSLLLVQTKQRDRGASRRRSCATRCSTSAAASTAARSTRSATSRSRWARCRARTARRCSPAARPRRWPRSRWARAATRS